MLHRLLVLLCMLLVSGCLSATLAWDEPLSMVEYENYTYNGFLASAPDGSVAIVYGKNDNNSVNYYLQYFSPQMQPHWINPIIVNQNTGKRSVCFSSDNYLWLVELLYEGTPQAGLYVSKYDNNGNVWGDNVRILAISTFIAANRFILTKDTVGGLHILVNYGNSEGSSYQHVSSSGVLTCPIAGLVIAQPAPESFENSVISLESIQDGGALIHSYHSEDHHIVRVDSQGAVLWDMVLNFSDVFGEVANIAMCGTDSFYCCTSDRSFIYLKKYDLFGQNQWSDSLLIVQDSGEAVPIKLVTDNNNNAFLLWSFIEGYRLTKISPQGQIQWTTDLVLPRVYTTFKFQLNPDNLGGCFVPLNMNLVDVSGTTTHTNTITMQHINSNGTAWTNPLFITTQGPTVYAFAFAFSSRTINSSAQLFYYANGNLKAGIYTKTITPDGIAEYPVPGRPLLTGKRRMLWRVQLFDAENRGALCLFSERDLDYTNATILNCNFALSDRSFAFPEHKMLDYSSSLISSFTAERQNDGSFVIVWDAGGGVCKMQMLSPTGELVFSNGAIVLAENLGSGFLIYIKDGAVYVAATPDGTQIKLHKFINASPIWDVNGVTIGVVHQNYPGQLIKLKKIDNMYLCWSLCMANTNIDEMVFVSRFDVYGSVVTPFTLEGLPLKPYSAETSTGYRFMSSFQDKLLVNYDDRYLYWEGSQMSGYWNWAATGASIIINSDGTFSGNFAYNGYVTSGYMLAQSDCYYDCVCIDDGTNFTLRKYNQIGQQLWSETIVCGMSGREVSMSSIPNGRIIVIYTCGWGESTQVKYFTYNPDGSITHPSDALPVHSTGCGNIATQTCSYGTYLTYQYSAGLACNIQYITSASGIDDPELSPIPLFSLNPAYPNPFNERVSWHVDMKTSAPILMEVYNVKGQKIRTLNYSRLDGGKNEVDWDGKDKDGQTCSSGVYLVKFTCNNYSQAKRIVKLR